MKKALLCVTDKNYLKQYTIAISSLIENCTTFDLDVKILSVEDDVETEDTVLYYLRSTFPSVSFEIIKLTQDQKDLIATFPEYVRKDGNKYITETTLFKIFGVETVKNLGYERCLYIDADILVVKNVDELVTTILCSEPKITAAQSDYSVAHTKIKQAFNAGVMIFNLEKMTDSDFKTFQSYIFSEKNVYGDQWIFNKMYSEEYQKMDATYNSSRRGESPACVFHFTGKFKPWDKSDFKNDARAITYVNYLSKKLPSLIDYGVGTLK
jgi:lipopolysaccharide biosynthesis glycosyltransferase